MNINILYDESMYLGGITESDFQILSSRIDLNCLINIRLKTGENYFYKIFLWNLNLKKFEKKSFIKWSGIKDTIVNISLDLCLSSDLFTNTWFQVANLLLIG